MLKLFAARRGTSRKNSKNKRTRERTARIETLEIRSLLAVLPFGPMQGGTPHYYGPEPNWANSPEPTVDPGTGAIKGGIQKFVDSLPGLYFANPDPAIDAANLAAADNNLGQFIPLAVPDTTTYLGSDYYEIALVQYTEKMNSSLNPTTLRGYVQLETPVNAIVSHHVPLTYPDGTAINDATGAQVYALNSPEYLGPTIVAAKDRPVRVKFTNYLPTGQGGDLFLPVDTTVMGSGMGPNMAMPMMADRVGGVGATVEITTMDPNTYAVGQFVILEGFTPSTYNGEFRVASVIDSTHFQVTLKTDPGGPATVLGNVGEAYTQNRAELHLHGGVTPWISDGTPHQWTTPAGENTGYPEGVSVQNVPDMPDPGPGSETFFYSNQQSARLMFYHDHAYGITRLNVYAGEAAGYLLTDVVEQDLITRGILPDVGIPLVIQDKTFIDPTTILTTDPTWPFPVDTSLSNLWAPHVYMPNQNPNAIDGANALGRWDYGPFFWPPWPTTNKPLTNPTGVTITDGGSGYTSDPLVTITPAPGDTTGSGATATATIDPLTGAVTAITLVTPGTAYTANPIVTVDPPTTPGGVTATVTVDTSLVPNVPDLSMTMEAYQDTPVVNGTAYPYLDVQPQAYRFRILSAADDRAFNLQLYVASTIVSGITVTNGGSGYSSANPPCVTITPDPLDTTGMGATVFHPVIDPVTGAVTAINLNTVGSEYMLPPLVTIDPPPPGGTQATATATIYTGSTEVGMVPAVPCAANFPAAWTVQTLGQPGDILDNRAGGVPDPRTIGPSMVQIGTEGGFLPSPVIWPNIPIGYERNPKNIVVGSVAEHNLLLGPAERADVVIDFSQFVGKTVILYNDAPTGFPAADSRLDYYTNDVDQTDIGGSAPTLPGYGPDTRTIMAFRVSATGVPTPFNLTALQNEFITTPTQQGVFARDQDPIIVPQAAYDSAYGTTSFPSGTTAYARIQSTSLTFKPLDLTTPTKLAAASVTLPFEPKAIQELFENDYGRMNATLGVELPFTNGNNQTTIPYGYIDPVTEVVNDTPNPLMTPIGSLADGTQIWKITHNGVDTHFIHFHLFNVQVINRVGWDGAIRAPDANELGWKDTVRMNQLEDIIVAFRAVAPKMPFGVPDSVRLLNPTMPQGSTVGFFGVDPQGNPVTVTNQPYNFGWEYVWHCHILSHEEMDMMRALQFNVARALPAAPVLTRTVGTTQVQLFWTDGTPVSDPATMGNPANEIGFRIERAQIQPNGQPGTYIKVGSALANATDFIDGTFDPSFAYRYRVVAFNAAGDSTSNVVTAGTPPYVTSYSLDADTGLSSTDQITNDTTPALTFVFNKAVFGTNADVTVTKPGGATVAPNSIVGWGTNTLTIAFTATALTGQGQYTVRLDGTTPSAITEIGGIPLNGGADEVRPFTIDTAGPTADVVNVTPDPRADAVGSIAILFSEAVGGVSLAGLNLSSNGGANLLTGTETLTSTDNVTWTLGNLTALTGTLVGGTTTTYNLILTGAGSGITDTAGNALAGNASDAWVLNPSTFTGTAGADTYEFIAAGGAGGLPTMHQLRVKLAGSPLVTYLYDATGSISLTVNAGGGSDKITVTGGPGVDASTINRYAVDHLGPGTAGSPGYYRVSASSVETIVDNAGAGTGQNVIFYDGPDNGDRFTASAQLRTGSMRSAGGNPNVAGFYNNSATGYDQISGAAPNGGTGDTATLYDSDGNDLFVSDAGSGSPQSSIQRVSGGTGTPALVSAGVGFETVTGSATNGGVDQAVLYGSSGNDSMNVQPALNRAYITVPGSYFVWALNFKNVTGYPGAGNDAVAFFDTAGNDVFTASPTQAQMAGPAGSNILNVAASDPVNSTYVWDTVRAYATNGGYDKAYLTGSTGNDTFLAYGKPRATNPGLGRLSGTGYFLEVYQFEEVYANLLTGTDTANLYDGSANDYFWGQLGAAVLTDGTVDNATGNLVTPGSYFYSVSGFDSPSDDHVNLYGTSGGTNTKKVIAPLDYVLATSGTWLNAP